MAYDKPPMDLDAVKAQMAAAMVDLYKQVYEAATSDDERAGYELQRELTGATIEINAFAFHCQYRELDLDDCAEALGSVIGRVIFGLTRNWGDEIVSVVMESMFDALTAGDLGRSPVKIRPATGGTA